MHALNLFFCVIYKEGDSDEDSSLVTETVFEKSRLR